MAAGPEARVFHTLDALRGIAAVAVVIFHMQPVFAPLAAPGGYLAVDLFFMMSGVVLSHAYEPRFRAGMGTLDFLRARLIRLYPLYLLGTLLGIAVTLASLLGRNINNWDAVSLWQAALRALVFWPNGSPQPVNQLFPLNIPCWSLFFELLVNLLFVVSWPLLTARRLSGVALLTGGIVVWAIARVGNIDQGSIAADFGIGLARTVFGFSVGVLTARRLHDARPVDSSFAVTGLVTVVAIATIAGPVGTVRAIWDAACVLVVFPLIVCCGTVVQPGRRLQVIATFLGVTSYAVYVLHSPLSSILNSTTRHLPGGALGAPYLGFAVMIGLLAGCWLVDRYLDMPIRRQLTRIIPKFQTSRSRAAS